MCCMQNQVDWVTTRTNYTFTFNYTIQHQLNRFVPADSTLVYMLYRVTECFSVRWLLYIHPYEGYIIHYDHNLDGSTCHMTFMIYSDVFIYNPSGLAGLAISQNFHFARLPIFFSIPDYLWFRRKIWPNLVAWLTFAPGHHAVGYGEPCLEIAALWDN